MEQDKIVFYKNKLSSDDQTSVNIYTESMEDFETISQAIARLVLFYALKYCLIGLLFGIFFGFSLAQGAQGEAVKAQVKQALISQKATPEQLTALMAIAYIESSFRPNAVGKAKEFGLFQFHPKYFKLADKSVSGQVKAALKHYKYLLTTGCKEDIIALCWNLGVTGASRIQQPNKFSYNKKFKKYVKQEFAGSKTFQVSDFRR